MTCGCRDGYLLEPKERRESGEDEREFRRFECRMILCAELGGRSQEISGVV